jgi:ribosome-binding factor A
MRRAGHPRLRRRAAFNTTRPIRVFTALSAGSSRLILLFFAMSRIVRINELMQRELSDLLHTRYRDRTVGITISEVDVTPDLRAARVYYSVLGDANARIEAEQFFKEVHNDVRVRMAKLVILKYTPSLSFHFDDSLARGNRTLAILDDLEAHGEFKNPPPEPLDPEDTDDQIDPTI